MSERHVCIHGHFYQPPRENPWLETIERQDSAYPYHDWNERVLAECYAPNAASRILDAAGRIVRIVNNYGTISFNMGPTLLAWMEALAPETYEAILEADRRSAERFGGHGSALAQVYNHTIMPLSHERDRRTQVLWGVRDFEHRFGRMPEGMWLPETAVDIPSLEALAGAGIRFTVLAPHQAARVRPLPGDAGGVGGEDGGQAGGEGPEAGWQDVSGSRVDPTRPYLQRLPSGGEIVIFFYDGPISRAVAFEGLLDDGERFARRLTDAFDPEREGPQLAHIGTDGESYGHHHRHGEMALSYALDRIESEEGVGLTTYGAYLEGHPPAHEVEIVENTSWSCAHGVERWRSDCGCSTGGQPGWNQAWRRPLREALDWLRDTLASLFEERAGALLRDPWRARDEYIDVILDRSPESVDRFFEAHAAGALDPAGRIEARELLELQRHAMLMYTSCGWFFTELSGIETVQVIQYAARALQLAEHLSGREFEPGFLDRLEGAPSNLPEWGDGRGVYEGMVRPTMVDLEKVCAHYALTSLFEPAEERSRVYCYRVDREAAETEEAGQAKLLVGGARLTSEITGESGRFSYAALRFGNHNVHGGVRPFRSDDEYSDLREELAEPFGQVDFAAVIRKIDAHFGEETYSLKNLFRDEQRRILDRILESTLEDVERVYRQVYERNASLMRFVADLNVPQPTAFQMSAEYVLNLTLRRLLEAEEIDAERVESLLENAGRKGIELDAAGLGFAFRGALERLARRARERPGHLDRLQRFSRALELARSAPFPVQLWEVQNVFYEMLQEDLGRLRERAGEGDAEAAEWSELFAALGQRLAVAVEAAPEAAARPG